MENYNVIKEYFEKSLMLMNYLENQSMLMKGKAAYIKNCTNDADLYENIFSNLIHIKNNVKIVKDKLSVLAFDLSAGDEALTEILDDVYLHQNQLMEIVTEMNNKNIFCEKDAE